jgi:hypothetical protein
MIVVPASRYIRRRRATRSARSIGPRVQPRGRRPKAISRAIRADARRLLAASMRLMQFGNGGRSQPLPVAGVDVRYSAVMVSYSLL